MRRCPRVHLLATSREPLGIGGETIYRVPSLSLPGPDDSDSAAPGSSDAVALFVERARAHGVGLSGDEQTGPLVVSICRRLDGMPLAIELAAARLRSLSLSRAARAAGPAVPAADRGQPHRPGAPADAAGGGRLVLFAADRRGAGAAGAPVGVRRRLRPGRGRGGVRVRRPRRAGGRRPARVAGGQEPGRGRARRSKGCGTGCWRPSGCSPPSGSSRPARMRPPRSPRRTARISCRWPRRRPLT